MPQLDEVSDERVAFLLDNLAHREAGAFCNFAIFVGELRNLLIEVQKSRKKPTHCPGCDGDHI